MELPLFFEILRFVVAAVFFGWYYRIFDRFLERALLGLFAFSLVSTTLFSLFIVDPKLVLITNAAIAGGAIIGLSVFIALNRGILLAKIRAVLYSYEQWLLLLALFNVVTLSVGLLLGNPLEFVASDTYKLVVFPATYFLVCYVVDADSVRTWFWILYVGFLALFLVTLAEQLVLIFVQGQLVEISSPLAVRYILPLSLVNAVAADDAKLFDWGIVTDIGLLVVTYASIFVSFSRSSWIITATISMVYLVVIRESSAGTRRLSTSGTAYTLLVAAAGFTLVSFQKLGLYIQAKVESVAQSLDRIPRILAYEQQAQGSLDQKIAEGADALKTIQTDGTILNYFVGMGNGAMYDVYVSKHGPINHHLHNYLFAMTFRRGLIGLALLLALYVSTLRTFLMAGKRASGTRGTMLQVAFLTILGVIIYDMSAASMFHNLVFAIFFGFCGALLHSGSVSEPA
jgi:hypothetical protein